jgi:hypothetical protein
VKVWKCILVLTGAVDRPVALDFGDGRERLSVSRKVVLGSYFARRDGAVSIVI